MCFEISMNVWFTGFKMDVWFRSLGTILSIAVPMQSIFSFFPLWMGAKEASYSALLPKSGSAAPNP